MEDRAMSLPPSDVREQVAAAVHAAVVATFGEDAATKCRAYARTGAELASEATGRRYLVVEGRLSVRGDGYWLRTDHAWFVCDHGGRVELVDLAVRHWGRLTADAPVPLVPPAAFLWTWLDRLPIGIVYAAESKGH
jgi:hypothetical protein